MVLRPAPSLAEEIASGIVRIRRRLVAEADRRLAERGKTVLAFQVLSALQRRGPSAQSELAEDIGQHPTGLSRLLEELEHARLVRRARDRADRRKIVVELTARGRALLAQGRPLVNAAVEEVLAPLGRASSNTGWTGTAAESFRFSVSGHQQTAQQLAAQLRQVARALDDGAAEIRRYLADLQRQHEHQRQQARR